MRLTNFVRDAFVDDVMRGLPATNYNDQIREVTQKYAISLLPFPIKAIWDNPGLRGWVSQKTVYFEGRHILVPTPSGDGWFDVKCHPVLLAKLRALDKAHEAQEKRDVELRARLRAVAYGCSTLKQLQEALPEFIAYMPEDEGKAARTLPVVQGVADEFKRAGWKDRKAA